MLHKVLTSMLAALAALSLHAVDLQAVGVEVMMHPDRYRHLLARFEKADTTLTPAELATVYFGYSFTPDYTPGEKFTDIEETYTRGDYELVERQCSTALPSNPVSLKLNFFALAAASRLHKWGADAAAATRFGIRSDQIATVILESGSGTTAASPFVVISEDDIELILKNVLGVSHIIDRTKVGDIDAIKVTFPGSDRQHILYFDNSRERQVMNSQPFNH